MEIPCEDFDYELIIASIVRMISRMELQIDQLKESFCQ